MENVVEEDLFILTLAAETSVRPDGRVKLVAVNTAGEAMTEATLSFTGNAPTFVETPYISEVLEGRQFCAGILMCDNDC